MQTSSTGWTGGATTPQRFRLPRGVILPPSLEIRANDQCFYLTIGIRSNTRRRDVAAAAAAAATAIRAPDDVRYIARAPGIGFVSNSTKRFW